MYHIINEKQNYKHMKKIFTFLILLLIIASCSKHEPIVKSTKLSSIEKEKPMTPKKINGIIKRSLNTTGNFSWSQQSDYLIWSAAMNGDSIITIGYGSDSFKGHKSKAATDEKEQIIKLVFKYDQINKKSSQTPIFYDDKTLNYIDIRIKNLETIKQLHKDKNVRYIEPSGYRFFKYETTYKSSKGCSKSPDIINPADYTQISPDCLVSWTYYKHNIPKAWNYSSGKGITVGLIDTGVSPDQPLLGSKFNDGFSSGRTIYKYGTYVDSWKWWSNDTDGPDDKCGHGTSMSATIASPRNDEHLPVGVAYNCNFIAYRGTSDVVLDGYQEQRGVANALVDLANNSNVKIISMSIGYIFSIDKIKDAVKYAYSRGKMIIAAGGTSTDYTTWFGVIFPANMSETVAVTGIKDNGFNACDVCHKGSKIDFTVIMERANDSKRHSVCLGYYTNTMNYVGGSSVATATTAGIAALIWARYPNWTRDQVLSKMKQSATFYPYKNASYGYGNIDAYKAVL